MFSTIESRIQAAADRATTTVMEMEMRADPDPSQRSAARRRARDLQQLAREAKAPKSKK